jgi:hypothetical protein
MNLIQFFNTENSSSSGLRATKPVVYQKYLTIASGTGAVAQALMPSLDITECAAYGGQIVNNGCYDLKVTAYYLKGDDCDACTVDTLSIATVEFYVPKNSVFPMPDGFYQKVDVQTVDSSMAPVSNTSDVKVSMHTSHVPNCTGCVNPVVIDEFCYEYTQSNVQEVIGWSNSVYINNTQNIGDTLTISHWELESGVGGAFALATPLVLSSNWPTIDLAAIEAAAQGELLTLHKQHIPNIDSVKVQSFTAGTDTIIRFMFFDSTSLLRDYTGTCLMDTPAPCSPLLYLAVNGVRGTGSNLGSYFEFEPIDFGGGAGPILFKELTINGETTYYEDGVLVTDQTRIDEIIDLIYNDPNVTSVTC